MSETTPAESTETWEQRAIRSARERHQNRIRQAANSVIASAEYVLRDLDQGRTPDPRGILSEAQVIVTRSEVLEAIGDVDAIFKSADVK